MTETVAKANARRRRGQPNDLKNTGGWFFGKDSVIASSYVGPRAGDAADRKANDLLINAQVVAVEVDDPYGLEFGQKIVVLRSTRNDPLADMRSRGQIEQSDYMAGRHWQNAHENSQIGSIKAIDPSKEAVDGGVGFPDMLSDRQRKGASDVDAARVALGPVGNALVSDVLADGLTISAAAKKRGSVSERDRRFLGARFRECLSTLAVLFGMATRTHG